MRYADLARRMRDVPAFWVRDMGAGARLKPHDHVQISHWVRDGRLVRLRRGLYTLSDENRKCAISPLWLANHLYHPSYVSLEYALSYFGLIPDAVGSVTSVTTLKTQSFRNAYGSFRYGKVVPRLFFGFRSRTASEGASVWMADPEKALLDFIYLSIPGTFPLNKRLFLENYRLQNLDRIRRGRLKEYALLFGHPRVTRGAAVLIRLLSRKKR